MATETTREDRPDAAPGGASQSAAGVREAGLVARARSGDVSAFERLYRAHVGRVYAFCLRLTGSAQDSEEMTQEVFVRAWDRIDGFSDDAHFGAWLHRVAVNLARNEWRLRSRRGLHQEFDERGGVAQQLPGPNAVGLGVDLEKAIGELPRGARTVFLLHDVHGYRHQEIAEMNGLAVGTTKAQLHRARRLLRRMLHS